MAIYDLPTFLISDGNSYHHGGDFYMAKKWTWLQTDRIDDWWCPFICSLVLTFITFCNPLISVFQVKIVHQIQWMSPSDASLGQRHQGCGVSWEQNPLSWMKIPATKPGFLPTPNIQIFQRADQMFPWRGSHFAEHAYGQKSPSHKVGSEKAPKTLKIVNWLVVGPSLWKI